MTKRTRLTLDHVLRAGRIGAAGATPAANADPAERFLVGTWRPGA